MEITLDRVDRLRRGSFPVIVSVSVAIVAVAFGIAQLVSMVTNSNQGVSLHPEDVAVTSLGLAPLAARENAVAVSTGREVIIWGGDNGAGQFFADGAAYDFATGKWHRIAPAPISGRSSAVAAWVGDHMIVWGGIGAHPTPHGLSDGAAYDPASNSWNVIAAAPASGRVGAFGAAFGGKLYIAGGTTPVDAQMSRQILQYDPASGRWLTEATVDPVYAAAATRAGLVTAEIDPPSGVVRSHLITSAGEVESIGVRGISGGVASMTLAPGLATPLLVVTGSTGSTSVYSLTVSSAGLRWAVTATMSSAEFRAVDDVESTLHGAIKGYPAGAALAVSSQGVWDLMRNSGRAVLAERDLHRHAICGAGSAYASGPYGIVVWGGQTCTPNGPRVTGSGVLINLRNASVS